MPDRSPYPTVRDYLDWAAAQGCTVACTPIDDVTQLALLTQPDGRHVFEVFGDETDSLASSNVARLDRRLGLKSYLFV